MPCGGIYPGSPLGAPDTEYPCWVCGEPGCDLFCDEWDTPLHTRCVQTFLETDEGQCVLAHGHAVVIVTEEGRFHVLHEERETP